MIKTKHHNIWAVTTLILFSMYSICAMEKHNVYRNAESVRLKDTYRHLEFCKKMVDGKIKGSVRRLNGYCGGHLNFVEQLIWGKESTDNRYEYVDYNTENADKFKSLIKSDIKNILMFLKKLQKYSKKHTTRKSYFDLESLAASPFEWDKITWTNILVEAQELVRFYETREWPRECFCTTLTISAFVIGGTIIVGMGIVNWGQNLGFIER